MVTSNYMRNPAQSKEMATGSFHLFIHVWSTWLFFCLEWLCYNLAHDVPGTMKHWEGAWLDLCRGQWIWSGDFLFSFNNIVYPARPFPACCEVIPKFQKLKIKIKIWNWDFSLMFRKKMLLLNNYLILPMDSTTFMHTTYNFTKDWLRMYCNETWSCGRNCEQFCSCKNHKMETKLIFSQQNQNQNCVYWTSICSNTYKEFVSGRWCLYRITTICKWLNTHTHLLQSSSVKQCET